jgi:zinc/manganese transport system substrate-binding protein
LLQLCRDTLSPFRRSTAVSVRLGPSIARQHLRAVAESLLTTVSTASLGGLAAASAILPASAQQQTAKLKVVATFSILGDFARNVGGDRVEVTTLVGSNGDVHVYTPTTGDAEVIRNARLVIINGLGLEGWLPRLVKSFGSNATTVVATHGIVSRKVTVGEILSRDRDAGSVDPHGWQSVANARVYVANICDAMWSPPIAQTLRPTEPMPRPIWLNWKRSIRTFATRSRRSPSSGAR